MALFARRNWTRLNGHGISTGARDTLSIGLAPFLLGTQAICQARLPLEKFPKPLQEGPWSSPPPSGQTNEVLRRERGQGQALPTNPSQTPTRRWGHLTSIQRLTEQVPLTTETAGVHLTIKNVGVSPHVCR